MDQEGRRWTSALRCGRERCALDSGSHWRRAREVPALSNGRATVTAPLTIVCPWTPYRILVTLGRREYTVNLTPNSGDSKSAYWGNPRFRGLLVSRARQEMRDAAYALTRDAL